ncbi:PREDICTED: uncharacterized protein LOC106742685 [Dinoponera quadriceps]|uniref:Uncharacterized protein LOC106742685 n=1 Tax=Dinoponera quadriceps TaxID=609295 RepID=A0A6P3WZ51_DINQU|nr:PREDICTED: uncharacterized protein LOC106742685 [Dinoponera quadriceps]
MRWNSEECAFAVEAYFSNDNSLAPPIWPFAIFFVGFFEIPRLRQPSKNPRRSEGQHSGRNGQHTRRYARKSNDKRQNSVYPVYRQYGASPFGYDFQNHELLVEEMTSIIKQEAILLSFDGDVRFLNFSEFDRQRPSYISLVRDLLDLRLWRRYGKKKGAFYRSAIPHLYGQEPCCT